MKSRRHNSGILAVLVVGLVSAFGCNAIADLVAADFNDVATGALQGKGGGTGLTGTWAGSSGPQVVAGDLTYPLYVITQEGTAQKVGATDNGAPRQCARDLAVAMSGEIWFSVLMNVPAGATHAGLTFNHGGTVYDQSQAAARFLMTPSQLSVGLSGGGTTTVGSFAAGTTHLVLGRMNVVTGNDTVSVWVDPNLTTVSGPGDLPAADYTSTTVGFTDSIIDIGAADDGGNGGPYAHTDAIRVSDTASAFDDVTGIVSTPYIALSSSSVASNAAPGTLVGGLSMGLTNGTFTYTLEGTDAAKFEITGSTNLLTAVWMTKASNDISIVGTEQGGGGLVVTNDFVITATAVANSYMAYEVSAEVNAGVAAGGELVGVLRARGADASAISFSLLSGRTDLFAITSTTNITQVAGTDPGAVGTINWIETVAANSVTTNYLMIGVEVVSGATAGTIFLFH